MLQLGRFLSMSLIGTAMLGCRDNSPPVPVVPPPQVGRDTLSREVDYPKPLPPQRPLAPSGAAPFYDEPLLVDTPPEARAFVEVYREVGRPKIVVFVNRTLEGQILPADGGDGGPDRVVERTRSATTGVVTEHSDYSRDSDRYGDRTRDVRDRFETTGPGEYRETERVYLRPGQYDEVDARAIDYGMMEMLLADWMAADNQVTIVSPTLVQRRLTDAQVKDLESGRPQVLSEIAEGLDADVLIQVQARPTRQTRQGLEVRILAEVLNLRGGESLARAAVDVPPPLDKVKLNTYTRFLARKLMDGMVQTWNSPPPARPDAPERPEAPRQPQRPASPAPEQPVQPERP